MSTASRVSTALATEIAMLPQRYVADFPVADLVDFPGNPKEHDLGAIDTSMKTNGFYGVVYVQDWPQTPHYILAGHGRKATLVANGVSHVPAVLIACDSARARKIVLVDNRAAELGGFNLPALAEFLVDEANAGSLDGTGYDLEDTQNLLNDLKSPLRLGDRDAVEPYRINGVDADVAAPLPPEPITQLGDRIKLGRHTLVCGDSRHESAWNALLGDRLAGMVWTDPPYGVSHAGGSKDPRSESYRSGNTIANDNLPPSELEEFLRAALSMAHRRTRVGGAWYVAAPAGPLQLHFGIVLTEMKLWRQLLTWAKDSFVFGRSDYHYRNESIFYGWKEGGRHTWNGGRRQDSVLECARPTSSKLHPTMKPVALIQRCIENSSHIDDLVVDPFGGSGSTLIAADASGREAALIELDPGYCDVIVERWESITSQRAERPR